MTPVITTMNFISIRISHKASNLTKCGIIPVEGEEVQTGVWDGRSALKED